MHRSLLLALALCTACSNRDNEVVGAIPGSNTTPGAFIDSVQSAIHATVPLTDASGTPTGQSAEVVVLANVGGLCDALQQNPALFRTSAGSYSALVLFAYPGQLGTFTVGIPYTDPSRAWADAHFVTGTRAGAATFVFPSLAGGLLVLTQFDETGEADGRFNTILSDLVGGVWRVYGRFKTRGCPALARAQLP